MYKKVCKVLLYLLSPFQISYLCLILMNDLTDLDVYQQLLGKR